MEKISVIVPVYNTEKFLPRCLSSLENQTYQNLEICLVDDGSTDQSREVIKKYREKDSRIHLYLFPKNEGVSLARNKGIDCATGDYIGFVDSDDYIAPNYYETLLKTMKKEHVKIASASLGKKGHTQTINFSKKGTSLLSTNISVCTNLYTRDLIGEDRFLPHCRFEDAAFSVLMNMKAEKAAISKTTKYYYCPNQEGFMEHNFQTPQTVLDIFEVSEYLQKIVQTPSYERFQKKIKDVQLSLFWSIPRTIDSFYYTLALEPSEIYDLMNHFEVVMNKKYGKITKYKGFQMLKEYHKNELQGLYQNMQEDSCINSFKQKMKTLERKH